MSTETAKIIGLTGPLASGKGVLADKLKTEGWTYFSLSQIVREEAREQGLQETRENLIAVGNKLRADYGLGVLAEKCLTRIKEKENLEKIVIDGIRNPGEVDVLKTAKNFFLIGIDAPAYLRYQRALARARTSDPAELEKLKATDEKDVAIGIYQCLEKSDVVVYNFKKDLIALTKEFDEIMYKNDLKLKPLTRPSKEEYYWSIALAVAQRATCLRRRFGAIIINLDKIVSTGYCGAPRNTPNCIDLGKCYRDILKIAPGQGYDKCRSVHAEENAMMHASWQDMRGAVMYIAGQDLTKGSQPVVEATPCSMCKRKIMNSQIEKVITKESSGLLRTYLTEEWRIRQRENPFEDTAYGSSNPKKT